MFKKKELKSYIKRLFNLGIDSEEFYEQLEDSLIEADISPRVVLEITHELKQLRPGNSEDVRQCIGDALQKMVHVQELIPTHNETGCWLFLGVNGVGKTTCLAKIAAHLKASGHDLVLAAGDTFRAAAIEQLEIHAQRLNIRCIRQKQGADAASVIFDAIESAASQRSLVLADSAGRMHTRSQLMNELQKIDRIIMSKIPHEHYKKILVIDATTGQNAVHQAQVFNERLGLDGIILSKYDSQAGGGLAITISRQLNIPFSFLGTGEGYEDIQTFEAKTVVNNIISELERKSED